MLRREILQKFIEYRKFDNFASGMLLSALLLLQIVFDELIDAQTIVDGFYEFAPIVLTSIRLGIHLCG